MEGTIKLLNRVAAEIYPEVWSTNETTSELGTKSIIAEELDNLNSDCGFGYSDNYKDPSKGVCKGYWANDDSECDYSCNVLKGTYWSISTYLGG